MKKRTLLYFTIYVTVLIVNVLIVLAQINTANVSSFSLPAVFFMFTMIIHAVLSYFLRHKGNYLPFKRFTHPTPFASDRDDTFRDEYLNRFFFMFKVYCLAIPFYIPQIFLTSSHMQSLWSLVPLFFPQAVYVVMGVRDTLKEVKEDKVQKQQLEKERLEQERRESMGKWK